MSNEIKVPDNLTEQQMADWLYQEHLFSARSAIISATVARSEIRVLENVIEFRSVYLEKLMFWDSVLQILKSKL